MRCSDEWIISSNPDIIIAPGMSADSKNRYKKICARSGWKNINAVRNRRIYTNVDSSILYRLGPRVLDAVSQIRKLIYEK